MKQFITILVFLFAFSSQSNASVTTIFPGVAATTTINTATKKVSFLKKATKYIGAVIKSAMEKDGKTIALIAHLTIIGLIIAFVMHKENPTEIGAFYLRQVIGLALFGIAIGVIAIIPILGWIVFILGFLFLLIMFILSILNALNEKMVPVPVIGKLFQKWFADLK